MRFFCRNPSSCSARAMSDGQSSAADIRSLTPGIRSESSFHALYQTLRSNVPDTGHHGQSDAINLFFFVIGHFRYGAKTLSNNSLLLKRPFTTHTVSTVDFTTTF